MEERCSIRPLLNGTIRQRLASLTRKCRHAARRLAALESGMWLLGCTYNLCWPHHELSRQATSAQEGRGEVLLTPAMASGLTDHIWSIQELLSYRVAPVPWVEPKRRGRPKKLVAPEASKQASIARGTTAPSALASSAERGFMLNHHLMESYP